MHVPHVRMGGARPAIADAERDVGGFGPGRAVRAERGTASKAAVTHASATGGTAPARGGRPASAANVTRRKLYGRHADGPQALADALAAVRRTTGMLRNRKPALRPSTPGTARVERPDRTGAGSSSMTEARWSIKAFAGVPSSTPRQSSQRAFQRQASTLAEEVGGSPEPNRVCPPDRVCPQRSPKRPATPLGPTSSSAPR